MEPILPGTAFAAALACATGTAALANCAMLAALFRRHHNGLYTIIAHLSTADLLLLAFSIIPELWSTNTKNWPFGSSGCVAYQGLHVFTSIASQYFVVAIALHSLATTALEDRAIERRINRKSQDDDEMRSSRRSLVTNSDSSTPPRTMNEDYRLAEFTVPVTLPVAFVWITAASVSIPQFLSAFTVPISTDIIVCIHSIPSSNIRFLLTIFNLFLPMFILSTAFAIIVVKFRSRKRRQLQMDNGESLAALKLPISLIIVQGLLCMPRNIASAYHAHAGPINEYVMPKKMSQLNDTMAVINMVFGSAYIVATLLRPLLCIFLMPHIRRAFFIRR